MKENAEAMVLASFLGDSLALGAHWIYDADRILRDFGRVEMLIRPPEESYHGGKDKGDLTHYGDQMFALLESVAAKKGFDAEDFSNRWRELFDGYDGYFDGATKTTLANLSRGIGFRDAGSSSGDLAGAGRISPLVFCYQDELNILIESTRLQTHLTHNHPHVVESGVFFAEIASKVLDGKTPSLAMRETAGKEFRGAPITRWVEMGLESRDLETGSAVSKFGQTCHTGDAFPGVVHLISKYENDLREALVANVMAGGDSAARGMIVGMVLGAYVGMDGIPAEWIGDLKKYHEIIAFLRSI
jgi:ADP-ribosylglycohydrolase